MLMAASGAQLGGMVTGASGNLAGALAPLAGAPWARINFSDNNKFTGAASATGFGASIGTSLKLDQDLTMGASYQLKSRLADMKTASSAASMTAFGGFADNGQITVIDFQMPSVIAIGASWQAKPALLLAADLKYVGWADSMKDFKLRYDSAQMGGSVSFALPQNWKDQTVLSLGAAWKANEQLTLRAGLNLADNPIPDATVNPLFPATVKNHFTLGLGYQVSPAGDFNMSVTMAPKVTVTTPQAIDISHAQTNWQFMYSQRY
jgi:long-chain fatty acid transport protein